MGLTYSTHLTCVTAAPSQRMERCLAATGWIAGTPRESMADLALACEAEQLAMIGYNLGDFPNVQAWLARLRKIPQYAEVRARPPCRPALGGGCVQRVACRPRTTFTRQPRTHRTHALPFACITSQAHTVLDKIAPKLRSMM